MVLILLATPAAVVTPLPVDDPVVVASVATPSAALRVEPVLAPLRRASSRADCVTLASGRGGILNF